MSEGHEGQAPVQHKPENIGEMIEEETRGETGDGGERPLDPESFRQNPQESGK